MHVGKLHSACQIHAYYPKVATAPRIVTLKLSPLVGVGTVSPMVVGLYLSFLPCFCVCGQPLLHGGEYCCASCPCGLTCQQLGIVWDSRNLVRMDKLYFPRILLFALPILSSFVFGIWRLQLWHIPGRARPLGGGRPETSVSVYFIEPKLYDI